MRITLLANNWVGWKVAEYLKEANSTVVALAIHSPDKARYAEEISETLNADQVKIFYGSSINAKETVSCIKALKPDLCLSIYFDYLLEEQFIGLFPRGVINLHPSFLPYNRGNYPNVWSIVDDTPAGATLHYIDKGIDTGSIIAQKQVEIEPTDTGESLYRKLEKTSLELFKNTWQSICSGNIMANAQVPDQGSYHRRSDVQTIDHIDLEKSYKAKDLINIIRARTFPPHRGAFFFNGNKRIYMKLQLEYEEEPSYE